MERPDEKEMSSQSLKVPCSSSPSISTAPHFFFFFSFFSFASGTLGEKTFQTVMDEVNSVRSTCDYNTQRDLFIQQTQEGRRAAVDQLMNEEDRLTLFSICERNQGSNREVLSLLQIAILSKKQVNSTLYSSFAHCIGVFERSLLFSFLPYFESFSFLLSHCLHSLSHSFLPSFKE
jgi:hypothetical protein